MTLNYFIQEINTRLAWNGQVLTQLPKTPQQANLIGISIKLQLIGVEQIPRALSDLVNSDEIVDLNDGFNIQRSAESTASI